MHKAYKEMRRCVVVNMESKLCKDLKARMELQDPPVALLDKDPQVRPLSIGVSAVIGGQTYLTVP